MFTVQKKTYYSADGKPVTNDTYTSYLFTAKEDFVVYISVMSNPDLSVFTFNMATYVLTNTPKYDIIHFKDKKHVIKNKE